MKKRKQRIGALKLTRFRVSQAAGGDTARQSRGLMGKPPIDSDRLWADLMALAAITDPDKPYTRRSFSPLFLKGRDWLKAPFRGSRT